MHKELVETINDTSSLFNAYPTSLPINNISTIIYHSAVTGRLFNNIRDIESGFAFSDFCSSMLELGKKVAKGIDFGLEAISAVGQGVALGTINSAQFAINTVIHPIDTTVETITSIGKAANALYKVASLAYNDPEEFEKKAAQFASDIAQTIKENPKEAIIQSVAFITELLLTRKAFLLGNKAIGEAASATSAICKMIKEEKRIAKAFSNPTLQKLFSPIREVFTESAELTKIGSKHGHGLTQKVAKFATQETELLKSKNPGKPFSQKINKFILKLKGKGKNKTLETGARRVRPINDGLAWNKWAPKEYDKIRACKTDIQEIAKNTGMPEYKIRRIKNHTFHEKHIIREKDGNIIKTKIKQFDPDPGIAAAWDRLEKGDFIKNDINLLEHEYFESKFERLFKTDYNTAHDKVKLRKKWTPPITNGIRNTKNVCNNV